MSEAFTTTLADGVATIHLGRPDDGNKLSAEEIRAIGTTIRTLGCQEGTKLVVVRGGGEAFCLGRAVGPAAPGPKTALSIRNAVAEPILALYADVRASAAPVMAVVHGEAKGFGCAMVGQCDLAIASDTARFSLPEMDTNLPPTLAISAMMGKVLPKRLLHMVYTRQTISAEDALAMGIVGEVVPHADINAAADALIARIATRSAPALSAVKEYLTLAPNLDAQTSARLAANVISVVLGSQ